MKKFLLTFGISLFSFLLSFAQIKEGHIAYTIEGSSDDEDMAMAVMMFQESSLHLYFSEEKTRAELNMGTLMSTSTVIDSKTGEVMILMGGLMGD